MTDALLVRRFPSVSRRLVTNPGARVSAAGFAMIVAQASADPELAVVTGISADLPTELRARLLRQRHRRREDPDVVARSLLSVRGDTGGYFGGIGRRRSRMSRDHDFKSAGALVAKLKKEGKLNEAVLRDFAAKGATKRPLVALAELSRASIEIVRPLMQSLRSDGILVPCRVAGLGWETVERCSIAGFRRQSRPRMNCQSSNVSLRN